MRKNIFAGAVALLGSVCAFAQPPSAPGAGGTAAPSPPSAFGLKRGQSTAKLALTPAPEGDGWLLLEGKVPQPHPEFEAFRLLTAPGVGLCGIRGVGRALSDDPYGEAVRERFKRVEAQLTQRYGAGAAYDHCDQKTSTCNAGYWAMHIKTGAREFGTSWQDGSKLPAGVKSIDLYVLANDISEPLVAIQYLFDNEAQCTAALDAEQSKAL